MEIHSFIQETYTAPLHESTTPAHSQRSNDQSRDFTEM